MAQTQLFALSVEEKMETDVQPTNHVVDQFDFEYFTYKPDPEGKYNFMLPLTGGLLTDSRIVINHDWSSLYQI